MLQLTDHAQPAPPTLFSTSLESDWAFKNEQLSAIEAK